VSEIFQENRPRLFLAIWKGYPIFSMSFSVNLIGK
jgi:hypothetical protein